MTIDDSLFVCLIVADSISAFVTATTKQNNLNPCFPTLGEKATLIVDLPFDFDTTDSSIDSIALVVMGPFLVSRLYLFLHLFVVVILSIEIVSAILQ